MSNKYKRLKFVNIRSQTPITIEDDESKPTWDDLIYAQFLRDLERMTSEDEFEID